MTETEPRKRWFVQIFEIVWNRPATLIIVVMLIILLVAIYTGHVKLDRAIGMLERFQ